MQHNLIQNAAQNISVAFSAACRFHRFRDGTAKAACSTGVSFQDLLAYFCCCGRGRSYGSIIGTHHFSAEGFLFIRYFYHEYVTIQFQVCTCHGKGCTPLTGTGFCCNAFQALHFCIVSLRNGRIQFMAAAGVITFKFIIDLRGSLQFFFQAICTHQGCRSVHFIKIQNFLRDIDICVIVIQFLFRQFFTEDHTQFFQCHGFQGFGIQQWFGFIDHIRTNIVPLLRHFRFFQIDFVRDLFIFFAHNCFSSLLSSLFFFSRLISSHICKHKYRLLYSFCRHLSIFHIHFHNKKMQYENSYCI